MNNVIVMVHGVGGTADAWSRLAPAFREKGWRVETPTLHPHKRLAENPPADLPKVRFKDYIAEIEALARRLEAETGAAPVLFGHSMGGLIVQKLLERGVGRAGVLFTPASPGDCRGSRHPAQAVTFANILFNGDVPGRSHRIWRFGFSWGVLNLVPRAKHAGIFAGTVYDSGGVYEDIAYPDKDPERSAFVDETKITAPILTLGGAKDRAVPIGDVRLLAEKYSRIGGDYLEYPNHAHWILDEPGTDQVIADIDTWLTSRGIAPGATKPEATAKAKAQAPRPAAPAPKPRAQAAKAVAKPAAGKPAVKAKPVTVAKPKATAAMKAKAAPVAKPVTKPTPKPVAKAATKAKTPVRKPKST